MFGPWCTNVYRWLPTWCTSCDKLTQAGQSHTKMHCARIIHTHICTIRFEDMPTLQCYENSWSQGITLTCICTCTCTRTCMLARTSTHTYMSFELYTGDLDQGKKIHYDFTCSITLKQLGLGNLVSNCNFRKNWATCNIIKGLESKCNLIK